MLESKYATYHLALFFPSPSFICIFSTPSIPCAPLLPPLPSSQLSLTFPFHILSPSSSLLRPQDLGSGTLPPIHWLPLYLQGANRTARTGEGTCMNKQLVRNNTLNHVLVSLSSRFEWTLVLWRAVPSVCTMTP